jgi:hypothetical protein
LVGDQLIYIIQYDFVVGAVCEDQRSEDKEYEAHMFLKL